VRYRRHRTRILCADPEKSVFYDFYCSVLAGTPKPELSMSGGSRIEGIGRPRVEASFIPGCVDAMVKVPDALSLAAMRHVSSRLGRRVGGSTGTNFIGVLEVARRMRANGQSGSIVTILCDGGERYSHSYYNPDWYTNCGVEVVPADARLEMALSGAVLDSVQFIDR
jgi:cysteine synthase